MLKGSRRDIIALGLATAAAGTVAPATMATSSAQSGSSSGGSKKAKRDARWGETVEGQRKADLGNGKYLNPVLAGDHADPSVVRDGDTYYKVSSTFWSYPGLVIWKSHDLVNWQPVGPALHKKIGSIFAPDFIKHEGRFYIYFPAANLDGLMDAPDPNKPPVMPIANFVVHADSITGPWSDPIDLQIYDAIDPGHVVGEDGKRYLFVSNGGLIPLSDDGLSRTGPTEKVYDGWQYPADWVVESFALESPKLLKRGEWYYMISAQGGTGGPPTSHMVVVARSRSVRGPWENSPHNPMVRTQSVREPWWSRGHATAVEGPNGDWWLIYHAYENGMRTLGRQMILEPMEWGKDGWPRATGGDLSRPMRKPKGGKALVHGAPLSDDFASNRFGIGYTMFKPNEDYMGRLSVGGGVLTLAAQGAKPGDSSPLVLNAGDRSYEVTVEMELRDGAEGGLLLFYDQRFFGGVGADGNALIPYKMGNPMLYGLPPMAAGDRLHLRVVNREEVASFYTSTDGTSWALYFSLEMSGYNHNIADGFLSLRPALYATKKGSVVIRNLRYRALD